MADVQNLLLFDSWIT